MQEVQINRRISSNADSGIIGRYSSNSVRKRRTRQKACPVFPESGNDFLKECIHSLPSKDQEELPIELDEEESMQLMYDAMTNYLGLLGKKFEYQLTGNFRIDICSLYAEFTGCLQKETYADMNLVNEWDNNYLELCLYHYPNVFCDEFVFLPISIVERLTEPLATLFLDFVGFYYKTQHVSVPEENDYFSYVIDFEAEEAGETADDPHCELSDEERSEYKKFAECALDYQNGGRYYPYFEHIINYVPDKDTLMEHFEKAKHLYDGNSLELIKCLIEGVELCAEDCIMRYNYVEGKADKILLDIYQDEIEPVELDALFLIIWDEMDPVVNHAMDYINSMISEGGAIGVCQYLKLTKETDTIFKQSTFPVELNKWFSELIEIINTYGTDK